MDRAPLLRLLDLLKEDFDLPDESPFENVDVDFSEMNIEILSMTYPSKSTAIASAVEYDNENSPNIELHCGFDDMSSTFIIKAWINSGTYNDRALTAKEIASLEDNGEFIGYLEDMIYNDIDSGDFPMLNEDFELPDESPFEFNKKKALEEIQEYLKQQALDFYIDYIEEAIVDGDEEETLSDYLESAAERYPFEFELVEDHQIPAELTEGFGEEELEEIVYSMEGEATDYAESEISEHPELYLSNYDRIGSFNAEDELEEDFDLPDESPFEVDYKKVREEVKPEVATEVGTTYHMILDDCTGDPEEYGIDETSSMKIKRTSCSKISKSRVLSILTNTRNMDHCIHAVLSFLNDNNTEGGEYEKVSRDHLISIIKEEITMYIERGDYMD